MSYLKLYWSLSIVEILIKYKFRKQHVNQHAVVN